MVDVHNSIDPGVMAAHVARKGQAGSSDHRPPVDVRVATEGVQVGLTAGTAIRPHRPPSGIWRPDEWDGLQAALGLVALRLLLHLLPTCSWRGPVPVLILSLPRRRRRQRPTDDPTNEPIAPDSQRGAEQAERHADLVRHPPRPGEGEARRPDQPRGGVAVVDDDVARIGRGRRPQLDGGSSTSTSNGPTPSCGVGTAVPAVVVGGVPTMPRGTTTTSCTAATATADVAQDGPLGAVHPGRMSVGPGEARDARYLRRVDPLHLMRLYPWLLRMLWPLLLLLLLMQLLLLLAWHRRLHLARHRWWRRNRPRWHVVHVLRL